MQPTWLSSTSIVLLGVIAALTVGCNEDKKPEKPVVAARVGTRAITMSAVNREIDKAQRLKDRTPSLTLTVSRRFVLRQMIANEWQRQAAIALKVTLPPGRLSAVERRTYLYEGLNHAALAGKRFPVTTREIREYYIVHRSELGNPGQRLVQVIEARTRARASQAARALRTGEPATGVRARYGGGVPSPTEDRGGLMIVVPDQGQVPKALERAIFRSPKGVVSGPVKAGSIWYVLRVQGITPAASPSLRSSRARIKAELQTEKRSAYFERFVAGLRTQYRPRTTCSRELLVPECRNGSQRS
jgi:type IV pilus biogenesis protein CpaD/CtpE